MRRSRLFRLVCQVGFAVSLFGRAARATDPAAAEALFSQAREIMKAGDYPRACTMLEESYRLNEGTGTRFNLGDCYEHLGRTASAWAAFRDVAAASRLAGHRDREAVATARAAALEPKLCRLKILPPKGAYDQLELQRDSSPIGPGQLGTLLPVDPGLHRIVASAKGYSRGEANIDVGGCPRDVTFEFPPLVAHKEEAPPALPLPRAERRPSSARSTHTVLAISAFGISAAGIVLGTYTGLRASSLKDDSNRAGRCIGNDCNAEGAALRTDSIAHGNVATLAFIGAGVFALGGILLLATMPSADKAGAPTTTGLTVAPTGAVWTF